MPLKAIESLAGHAADHQAVPGKPGLSLDVGHHHLGLTLGPITGRLLAEIMAGEAPFVEPARSRRNGSAPDQGGTGA